MHQTFVTKPGTKKLLALLLATTMAMSACGSSGDDDSSETIRDRNNDTIEADGGETDAEGAFASTTTAPSSDDGFSFETTEAMADESWDATSESDGGFFAPEPAEDAEAERAREENNTFQDYGVRDFVETSRDPLSTFALDVDTASYGVARQWISESQRPPAAAIRVEEFVNSFDYDYPAPSSGLTVVADAGPSPFHEGNIVLRLGVQAEQVRNSERPDAALTFVVDTSGSMDRDDRLGLVKLALERLVTELSRDDSVAIVTYSDGARVLLPPTSVRDRDEILDAIDSLEPNGSTNLEAGLIRGYELANEAFLRDGINRVILASDGVANVGLTDPDGLVRLIRDDADEGIQLVTVGVGMGNFNDVVMETLADDGDGFYAYVNEPAEAERLFSDDLVSTLLTVAIDGKIQVEFDDENVASYRLLGFENRAVLDDDFRNDAVDAGELGAGHQVTALYELELRDGIDSRDRLGTAALRWEDPQTGDVVETRLELTGGMVEERWQDTAEDYRLAVTVGAFAEILRESQFATDLSLEQVAQEADALAGRSSEIRELAELIRRADQL